MTPFLTRNDSNQRTACARSVRVCPHVCCQVYKSTRYQVSVSNTVKEATGFRSIPTSIHKYPIPSQETLEKQHRRRTWTQEHKQIRRSGVVPHGGSIHATFPQRCLALPLSLLVVREMDHSFRQNMLLREAAISSLPGSSRGFRFFLVSGNEQSSCSCLKHSRWLR